MVLPLHPDGLQSEALRLHLLPFRKYVGALHAYSHLFPVVQLVTRVIGVFWVSPWSSSAQSVAFPGRVPVQLYCEVSGGRE